MWRADKRYGARLRRARNIYLLECFARVLGLLVQVEQRSQARLSLPSSKASEAGRFRLLRPYGVAKKAFESLARFMNRATQRKRSYQVTRKNRSLVDEIKFVAKGVRAVKTAFAPGLRLDWPKDGAVRSRADATVVCIEIVYREVHMVRIRRGVPRVAVSPWIKACEDDAATPKVMPSRRDPSSGLLEDSRVKDCGVLDA